MEFGVFHEFQCLPGQAEADAFADSFTQIDLIERLGLDVLWLAELHAAPGQSVLASPLTIAAAVAARTRRIRIGTAVQVLPLAHPLRLAEEVATVDHLSHGRLIFGVGRSGFPQTYAAFGVPYGESRERFTETLAILRRAWTDERFSYDGRFFSFRDVCLVPKPYQRPHPEIRIAATSPDTYAAIGALGYPIFCAVRLGTLAELGPSIGEYRAAWRAAGHPGQGRVYLRVPIHVAATDAVARAEPQASVMGFYRFLGRQLEASAWMPGARAEERRAERGERLLAISYDDVLRDKVIAGTPDAVAARLIALRDQLGLDGILAEPNCGREIPHARVMASLTLLGQAVMPVVKAAAA
jgi:alkanesulfonate monooxygenase SsuD/methylene tetrahydromethanopterin reductase-like flavin-dependent oxidoreductase (luciferase family)